MSNVFVISSPLQLLNATEAAASFHRGEENELIVCKSIDSVNYHQTTKLIDLFEWSKVDVIRNYGVWQFCDLLEGKRRRKGSRFAVAYIGEPFSAIHTAFAESLAPHGSIIFLDDGLSTLDFVRYGAPNDTRIKMLISGLLGLQPKRRNYDFFSAFPYAFTENTRNSILAINSYSYIKSLRSNPEASITKKNGVAYIIGDNIVEEGLISSAAYIEILYRIVRYLSTSNKIYYLPHRRELKKNLDKIINEIPIDIYYSSTAIEYEFLKKDTSGDIFVSLQSTALVTMSYIYDNASFIVVNATDMLSYFPFLDRIINDKHALIMSLMRANICKVDL